MFSLLKMLLNVLINNISKNKMGKIDELKKQNPELNFNIVDFVSKVLPKPKYVEMAVNLIKNGQEERISKIHTEELKSELRNYWNVPDELLNNKSNIEIFNIFRAVDTSFNRNEYQSIIKFIELNERKLIEKSDLTSYKSFDEIDLQNSLADLKLIDKEFQKQVVKLHEDDEWLVIKPLSWAASKKYGANTKWCTSSEYEQDYFYRYVKRGILIYSMNKKTGNKVAGFKNVDNSYEKEISFWDIKDNRVDSLEANLPYHIMDIFKDQFFNCKTTNWDILSDDEKITQQLWLESHKNKLQPISEQPDLYEAPTIAAEIMPNESRIIQMYNDNETNQVW
jgi:hypothetical protein